VIGTAAAPGFQMQSIPNDFGSAFVAIHGSTLDYVAVQEMLDRIVYRVELGGAHGLFVSDLFGGNAQQINGEDDYYPDWSPDGEQIVAHTGTGVNSELVLMDDDGSNRQVLTSNSVADEHPSFSPDGLAIAFSGGDGEGTRQIHWAPPDGSVPGSLRDSAEDSTDPAWTPDGGLLFIENGEVYHEDENGNLALLTLTTAFGASNPTMSADGQTIAFESSIGASADIWSVDEDDRNLRKLAWDSEDEIDPCFSSDGRFMVFSRRVGGNFDLVVKQTHSPHREFRVTDVNSEEIQASLGSPTPQTSRVLVGSSDHADDNRGFAPYHNDAQAAILAYDTDGYRNFVKIVLPGDPSTLELTPMAEQGNTLVGVRLTADWVGRLHQDAGPGEDTMWNFKSLQATAAVVHLDAQSGKVASVIVLKDSVYPSAEGGPAVTESVEGATTVVRGPIRAVYGANGELVAEGDIGTVEIDGTATRAY
jgi:Tol biopolymer transport system component